MILVLLPAYNEAPGIGTLLKKIQATMEAHSLEYRILVVNDGSRDETASVLADHAGHLPLEVLSHTVNRGLWETVRDAFEWAAERCEPDDVIVRMDADDTHDPAYIPVMLDRIREGYDVVIASRFHPGGGTEGLNLYRRIVSRCANLFMKAFFPIPGVLEYSCGFRAYRAELVQAALTIFGNAFIDLKGVGFTCTAEKLIKLRMLGARITEIPFVLRYDQKVSESKMLAGMTTVGYLLLILKYIYPWGRAGKQLEQRIREWRARRASR